MGYRGGAPSWVVQNRADAAASSLRSQIYELEERVKTLQEENSRLKKQLDEANTKYEEFLGRASRK
jgi:chaperonin cofactor prefoldin